jgi:deoxyribodipyrimidine photo-lyase
MPTRTARDHLDLSRVRYLNDRPQRTGPVVYWMSRDQRAQDNWALLYAQQEALRTQQPLAVVFNLVPKFLGATLRQYVFFLQGLQQVEQRLRKHNIPFFMTLGKPQQALVTFLKDISIGLLVTDFSPLRIYREWKKSVARSIEAPVQEVDAHNIVPCWVASDKQEYAARTFRPRINRLLSKYLTDFPRLRRHPISWGKDSPETDFKRALKSLRVDRSVTEIRHLTPGEEAARDRLLQFVEKRLALYAGQRNDPSRDVLSGLSPYLHFGQISAQRVALEIQKSDRHIKSQEAFVEELVVRRELSDNFCYYNSNYDNFEGFPRWAKQSLDSHRTDPRPHLYDLTTLEHAQTHDELWNAAQKEMVLTGKMHGYMRMYWAKKILQWSISPEEALRAAIYLNDRYQLDGRDPNGYTGIAWSIGGVHDRAWFEREISGKVRYMSSDGCRRKFDTPAYIRNIDGLSAAGSGCFTLDNPA